MINFAHLHLVLNHLPIMTIPIALIFYVFSIYKKDEGMKKFSLIVLIATAITVVPVFLTGEPAEEVVENMKGISKSAIHDHEEVAEIALILTLVAGGIAFLNLLFGQKIKLFKKYGDKIVIGSCILALGFLVYTANKGGKISHPELSSSARHLLSMQCVPIPC